MSEDEAMREVFRLVDRDESGEIDAEEISKLLEIVGMRAEPQKVRVIMEECDANGSGAIEWAEFLETMKRPVVAKYTSASIRRAFQRLGDGHAPTLKIALRRHGVPEDLARDTLDLLMGITNIPKATRP